MGKWKAVIWIVVILLVVAGAYFAYSKLKVSADSVSGSSVKCTQNNTLGTDLYIPDRKSNQFFIARFVKNLQRPSTTDPSLLWNSTAIYILNDSKVYLSDGIVYTTPSSAASGYLVLKVGNAYYRVDTTSTTATGSSTPATYYAYKDKLYSLSSAPGMQQQNSVLFQINGTTAICYNGKPIEIDSSLSAQMIPTGVAGR